MYCGMLCSVVNCCVVDCGVVLLCSVRMAMWCGVM